MPFGRARVVHRLDDLVLVAQGLRQARSRARAWRTADRAARLIRSLAWSSAKTALWRFMISSLGSGVSHRGKARIRRADAPQSPKREIYQLVPQRGMVKHAQLCEAELIFRRSFALQEQPRQRTTPSFRSTGANRRWPPSCNGACAAAFARVGLSVVTELSLANGRRADVVALSSGRRHC